MLSAVLPGARTAPVPINLDTVNEVFGNNAKVQAHLAPCPCPTRSRATPPSHGLVGHSLQSRDEQDRAARVPRHAIAEFFGFTAGELPHRSLRFHHRCIETAVVGEPWSGLADRCSVLNFMDSGQYTRKTAWHLLPGHLLHDKGKRLFTREEPCDDRLNNMERSDPVQTADRRYDRLHASYAEPAKEQRNVTFIGRCGTYRYLDVDQVIIQALMSAEAWLRARLWWRPSQRRRASSSRSPFFVRGDDVHLSVSKSRHVG